MIRNGFIYKPADVAPRWVASSKILSRRPTPSPTPASRWPRPSSPSGRADADAFAVVVNHFKSKGSGRRTTPTGQGRAPTRTASRQADGAARRSPTRSRPSGAPRRCSWPVTSTPTREEDPMQVLYDAGYDQHGVEHTPARRPTPSAACPDRSTTSWPTAGDGPVTGADIWDINAAESVAYQYSRFNYNVTRSSTRTDAVRGVRPQPGDRRDQHARAGTARDVQILGTNDFHGRIANDPQAPRPAPRCWRVRSSSCGQRTRTRCSPRRVT